MSNAGFEYLEAEMTIKTKRIKALETAMGELMDTVKVDIRALSEKEKNVIINAKKVLNERS